MDQMLTFGDYLAVVRRRMWWVIGAVAVCLLLALAYSKHQTPKYQAEATVVVGNVTPPPSFGGGGGSSGTSIERYVATQATIGSSTAVAKNTVQDPRVKGASITPQQFVAISTVAADSTANTLHFTVVAHSSDLAVNLANAFADQYVQLFEGVAEGLNAKDHRRFAGRRSTADSGRARARLSDGPRPP